MNLRMKVRGAVWWELTGWPAHCVSKAFCYIDAITLSHIFFLWVQCFFKDSDFIPQIERIPNKKKTIIFSHETK